MSKPKLWTPKPLYNFWNARYFRGRLPDIPVVWSKKEYARRSRSFILGSTHHADDASTPAVKITLNPRFKKFYCIWVTTLLHEMVHVQQWRTPEKQKHGRKFQKRIKQLVALGAYNNLL